jgi:xanthine dehydrogenase accessory factor
VIEQTGIAPDQLLDQIHGPAGLDLRAQLPETIALSILAECHARLYGGSGQPMKNRTHCS